MSFYSLEYASLVWKLKLSVDGVRRCVGRFGRQCERRGRAGGDHPRRPGRAAVVDRVAGGPGAAAAGRVPEPVAAESRRRWAADPAAGQPLPSTSTAWLHSPLRRQHTARQVPSPRQPVIRLFTN